MTSDLPTVRFADLFAGIGGFHAALRYDPLIRAECIFASDIDDACREVYEANFGFPADGDIWPIARDNPASVDDHDLLCAGFPCQPFSKSGQQRGIAEARGTLFEAILLILEEKRPRFVLLENVRNLVGPRHTDTWATIVRLLRDYGYAVSQEPTLLSPHELPPGLGSPQIRDRVFIPAVHVGRKLATQSAAYLPRLVGRRPYPDWHPSDWRVEEYLRGATISKETRGTALRPAKVAAVEMWQDFINRLPGPIPRFPVWTDVFLGLLSAGAGHPAWKNATIAKNKAFYLENRRVIDEWLEANGVAGVVPSYRKFEWQAQDHTPDLWRLAIQFRPSGVRVRPLTYLPALVAINQTSIIGPWRREITKDEAAWLQGFTPELLGGNRFAPDEDDATAFQQFGNAVHVGVTRFVARALLLGAPTLGQPAPPQWQEMIVASATADRSPAALESDDALPD